MNDEESWGSGLDHFANLSINDPAVYPFHVQATTHVFSEGEGPWDLKEDDWNTPISNVVMLKVTADGRVGRADASLEKDTVNRGDLLPVTITSAGDGTEWLGLYIADVDSDWLRASAETKTIYYPTSRLKAGKYALVIESCAEGKVSARRQLSFTVEEKETEQIHFEVGADTAIKNEEIPVSVYAPDAIWIRVCGKNVDRPWDGEREYFFENGPAVGGNIGLEAGTNILWAEACFENDEIAEGGEIVKSKEFIIEVNSLGKLTACPITVDALQSPGKDVIIRVDGLAAYENDWWDLHVWDESAESEDDDFDNTILRKTVRTSETVESFTVPASILKKNHRYHVNVWVDRDGYNGADSDTYFYIIDAENDENVSLEIRKAYGEFTNTDIKDAQIQSQAFFRLTAPNTATAFMKFNGHDWHDQEIDDGIATWEEKLDTDNTAYAVRCWYGDREVFYQMLEDNNWQPDWEYNDSDGNHFGGLSNVVTVSFAPFGYAESPIVSFPEYSEDGATRGTHLMVDVNTTEYGINAVSAWVENEEIGFGLDGVSFPYEFGIPTARLTEGEYTLRVSVSGPGKNWSEAISLPFTVIENTDEPVFSVAGQCGFEPNVGVYYYHLDDDLFYTGYASGEYDHMKVIFSEDEDGKNVIDIREYNDPFDDNFHLEHPGQFFIRMVAFINSDESDESPWFNNIPIIIDPVGEFEPFGIEVAPVFTEEEAANGVTFTVEGPENAGYGWWDIWVDDLWEDTEMPRWNRDEDPVSNTFTIPADKLKPDHSYRIHMYVDADGYIGMGTEATFSIVKAIDNTIKLTINGQSGKATVPCYTDFTMRVEAKNAQMVSFFDGNDWWLLYPEFDPNTNVAEFTNGADMAPGEYTLLVRATDDPDFWNNFDKDHQWEWSDMKINWRAVGEPFKLIVISKGDLAEPHMDLRVPEEGVTRGELIEAVINYPENEPLPERIRITIRDEYENREYYWTEYWPEQFPFTMLIPTTTMGEGNYRADVELIKSGYNAVFVPDEDVPFRVRETDEDIVFRAELPKNRNLLPHEDFLVSAYVKGAARLELYASDVKQASENPDQYEPDRWNYDGGSFADDSISVNEGEHELYLLAYGPGFDQNGTKILYENHLIARPEEGKRMQPAEIDMKLIEEVGKPHTFVVSGIERADWWWNVNIWDEENGMPVIYWNRDNTTNRTEFTIPSDKLEDGHRYNIDIWLDAKYLGGAGMSMRFAVVDPEKKAELILPAAVNKVESGAFSNLGDKQLLIISGGKEGTKLEDGSFAENDALIAVQLPEGFVIGVHWEAFPLGEATVIEFISD